MAAYARASFCAPPAAERLGGAAERRGGAVGDFMAAGFLGGGLMTAIHLQNLTLGYDRHPAVHHLDAELQTGSLTALVGPNGAGKSTLLKAICGALPPLAGRVAMMSSGRPLEAGDIAYLPQQARIDRDFPLLLRDFVAMGLWHKIGAFAPAARHRHAIEAALAATGLTGFTGRPVGTLSGGQMQRALFARLLLQDSPVILLDEPLTGIDEKTAADLTDLIHRWHGEKRTIVIVSHDFAYVRAHCPRTLLLAREIIAHGPTQEVLRAVNLFRARQLCEAFDERAAACSRQNWR